MLRRCGQGNSADADIDEVLRKATEAMINAIASNEHRLARRQMAYRATVVVRVLEISWLLVALRLSQR